MTNARVRYGLLFAAGLSFIGCAQSTTLPEGETDLNDVTTDITTPGSDGQDEPTTELFSPASAVLPRLTSQQYINAIQDIFGITLNDIPLEADTNPYLFYSVGATTTEAVSYTHLTLPTILRV